MKRLIFDVPGWHLWLHRQARGMDKAQREDGPRKCLQDELFDRLYSGEAERLPEGEQDSGFGTWAAALHATCDALPAFRRLATECRGDSDAAAQAVETVMTELRARLPAAPTVAPPPALRRALVQACEQASKTVEEAHDAAAGFEHVAFGYGQGAGTHPPVDGTSRRTLALRLRGDERLKHIALLAGRFKRILAAKRRQRVRHGADEVTDVEQGADLARLLPAELARLTHPRQRLALLRDYAERQCLQYQLAGTETLGKGPLVVCLDKSGSMDGASDIWATAVAIALLDVAHRERRPFALLCFDDGIRYEAVVPMGEQLPEQGLLVACGGGTDIASAIERGLKLIEERPGPLRKADVVLITDGASSPERAATLRTRAATLGVSILGFGIGVPQEVLLHWCDDTHVIRSLTTMDEKAAELFGGI